MNTSKTRIQSVLTVAAASLTIAACGGGHDTSANVPAANSSITPGVSTPVATAPVGDTVVQGHHSKLAGAAIGAAAGHMLGGHAVAGAAIGAIVQHERNKHRN